MHVSTALSINSLSHSGDSLLSCPYAIFSLNSLLSHANATVTVALTNVDNKNILMGNLMRSLEGRQDNYLTKVPRCVSRNVQTITGTNKNIIDPEITELAPQLSRRNRPKQTLFSKSFT